MSERFNTPRIVTYEIVQMVDDHIDNEIRDIAKYSNRQPFDESGNFDLHRHAAAIYAKGFDDGERIAVQRDHGQRLRDREKATDV